ncbi:MAG TPA: putative peptidoglycan glycosyltransferase FtsW [Candidatus Acidoferrales bacterium]|jgi:cell division protein FtsW|nr:putative peptidoglycan glycosyltransferase FtsW [Candidatus Acidoferrales bacterium]
MPLSLQPDKKMFGVTLALCLIGAVMVFSASAVTAREQYGNGYFFLLRQALWLAIGIAGMFALMNLDYRKLRQPRVVFTILSLTMLMLIAVFFLDRSHATHRWIRIGPLSLQPSEIAKLAVIFYLAWFIELRRNKRGSDAPARVTGGSGARLRKSLGAQFGAGLNDPWRSILPVGATLLLVLGLVVAEPDMGTACMISLIAFVMLYVSGLSMRYVAGAIMAAMPIIYLLIVRVPYRLQRVQTFFSPGADPQGHGFQLLQSLIAVGSGGFSGVGLMESHQKLFFLPEAHTDFIFSIICEEFGFIGAAVVLALFAVYGWRGFVTAMKAPDQFGRLLGVGITTMVVGQALINLSVVLGLLPTKGIPLPFVSYGGSSLLGMLLATGVLLNISQHADVT